ncbi:flagellar basal-body rod modification protein FlgD [Pullulanibacillus pueri]|uniref:Flagellar hook capping protein n=1 Tax=Pullulanibacillus pueri TaxID=1437324 RepID=A0A8J3EMD2_9BACL|nr:flagellar hook assembly protein FlgD [Pullulanibacillus pueri]MBM7682481.1 flagellar basal-body rod modification protein FlgD [Pullulanibacillus pueri]GGH82226.1 hypothetical protein GCM10007096_21300 [Pullulanibacillus pueri]
MKVDPSLLWQNQNQTNAVATNKDSLGKDDFLKLLITQLQSQDPENPMDDTQFISQMANFTSLEQTNNMTDMLSKFVDSQSNNMLGQLSNVIGKTVSWELSTDNEDGTTDTQSYTDVVKAVTNKDGQIYYLTQSGQSVDPATVTKLADASLSDQPEKQSEASV